MHGLTDRILDWIWKNGLERVTRLRLVDRIYAHVAYWSTTGRFPNTRNPSALTEHLTRIKASSEIYSPLRVRVSDKEHVKEYVTEILGAGYVVPTIAILRSPAEVDSFDFPPTCVIKPTHSSGECIIRQYGKPEIDRAMIKSWFAINHYARHREANYRKLTAKIIVEELLLPSGKIPLDYKIYCFSGRPKIIHVLAGRQEGGITSAMMSPEWEYLQFRVKKPGGLTIARPKNLAAVLDGTARVTAPFSFVRADLYVDDDKFFVGELTNLPAAGNLEFIPREADALAGVFMRDPDADPLQVFSVLGHLTGRPY